MHYAPHIKEIGDGAWSNALAQIGEMYYGIRIPKAGNPLLDMMGSMFFGGGGGGGAPRPKVQQKKPDGGFVPLSDGLD